MIQHRSANSLFEVKEINPGNKLHPVDAFEQASKKRASYNMSCKSSECGVVYNVETGTVELSFPKQLQISDQRNQSELDNALKVYSGKFPEKAVPHLANIINSHLKLAKKIGQIR